MPKKTHNETITCRKGHTGENSFKSAIGRQIRKVGANYNIISLFSTTKQWHFLQKHTVQTTRVPIYYAKKMIFFGDIFSTMTCLHHINNTKQVRFAC